MKSCLPGKTSEKNSVVERQAEKYKGEKTLPAYIMFIVN
jgi:hypothetical protein